jgi:hypothetical protein
MLGRHGLAHLPTLKLTSNAMNTDSNDRQFFNANPRRSYRCRLVMQADIDGVRTHGISVEPASHNERFVHCIARRRGQIIDRAFIAIGLLGNMDEQHYRQALHDVDSIMGGQVERLAQ